MEAMEEGEGSTFVAQSHDELVWHSEGVPAYVSRTKSLQATDTEAITLESDDDEFEDAQHDQEENLGVRRVLRSSPSRK